MGDAPCIRRTSYFDRPVPARCVWLCVRSCVPVCLSVRLSVCACQTSGMPGSPSKVPESIACSLRISSIRSDSENI